MRSVIKGTHNFLYPIDKTFFWVYNLYVKNNIWYAKQAITGGIMSQFKKFEYVIAISEAGGISQAAEKLDISQPTLSKYIKKLETELGLELFDRSTLPLRATRAGECYIEAGKRLMDIERQLDKQLEEIKLNKSSVIRVGISPSRSPYMMPTLIEEYKRKNPNSKVVIEERTTAELSERLFRGELDLIISLLDEATEDFEREELFCESIFLAAPRALSAKSSTALELMLSLPIISVGKGQSMWQKLIDLSEEIGAPAPEIECQSIESGLSLVKRGLGVMIAPSYIKQFGTSEQNKDIEFIEIPSQKPQEKQRKVCVFYRKEQFLTKSEQDFISCAKILKE